MEITHSILWEDSDPWRQLKQLLTSLSLADLAINEQGNRKNKTTKKTPKQQITELK